jgi:50S ribosomal protein L16 3-hydroxylase
VQKLLGQGRAMQRCLGEYLTEPKASVWFDEGHAPERLDAIRLDRRTRMMYDAHHVFINGESWRAGGRDARLLHQLADERSLDAAQLRGASAAARALMGDWCAAGWAHGD